MEESEKFAEFFYSETCISDYLLEQSFSNINAGMGWDSDNFIGLVVNKRKMAALLAVFDKTNPFQSSQETLGCNGRKLWPHEGNPIQISST